MVKNNIRKLIDGKFPGKRRINISEVADATDLTRQTVMQWYYEADSLKRYEVDVLNKWCAYLNVGVGDILEYVPDGGSDQQ